MNNAAPEKNFRVYPSCAECKYYRNLNDVNGIDLDISGRQRRHTDDQSPDRCVHPLLIGGDIHTHSVGAEWARCDTPAGLDRCGPRGALFDDADESKEWESRLILAVTWISIIAGVCLILAVTK